MNGGKIPSLLLKVIPIHATGPLCGTVPRPYIIHLFSMKKIQRRACLVKMPIHLWLCMMALMVVTTSSRGQIEQLTEPDEITRLWTDWMVTPATSGPRLFVRTQRDVIQTSSSTASFQSGTSEFILADGGVGGVWRDQIVPYTDEWDTDRDGFRDVVEQQAEPPSDPLDPLDVPTGVTPDVFWTILANGLALPVSQAAGSTAATYVRPFSLPNVKLSVAPAQSTLPKPLPMFDYSTRFLITDPNNPSPTPLGLSLYAVKKNYAAGELAQMERDVVPGPYQVQFPTVSNPYTLAGSWVSYNMVPNGSFTLGLRKPTWLVRSAESLVSINKSPVENNWVNGRIRFDPAISTTFKWDNLVSQGLSSGSGDLITAWIEDENQSFIWPPNGLVDPVTGEPLQGSGVVLSAASTQLTLLASDLLPPIGPGNPLPPDPVNGFLVLKYTRNLVSTNSGDLSTVTLRVPIEMLRSYASWRLVMFPGLSGLDESVSGPNADPDGDGLTNQQEYEQGSDPAKPTLGITSQLSEGITAATATLGATVTADPFSNVGLTVYERGIIYSPSATNSSPLIDGSGVNRMVSDLGTVPLDSDGDGWSDAIENAYEADIGELSPNPDDPNNPLPWAANPNAFPPPSLYPPDAIPGVGAFTVDVSGLAAGTEYSYRGYVISNLGVFYGSPVSSFSTSDLSPITLPTVASPFSSGPTLNSINLGGVVTNDGGSPILETGVVYSVTSLNDNPFMGGPGVIDLASATAATGIFSVNVTALAASTTYSFRAYALTNVGISYTNTIGTFTTPTGPLINAPTVTEVTSTSAKLGATVTSSGGLTVLQRGVVFSSTNVNPQIGGAGVSSFMATSTGLGTFTVNVTGLQANTLYYFKAYAINSVATSYTTVGTFTTVGSLATLSNPTIKNLTATSVEIGATVVDNGQLAISERGFIYSPTSVNSNPFIGGNGVVKRVVSGDVGVMLRLLTGLAENTSYTFKAYAINGLGTAYGSAYAFFTTMPPLTVNSPTASDVADTTAKLGGTVVSDQSTTVDARGVVYSNDPATPPTINGPGVIQVIDPGTGTMGVFTVDVSGLNPDTRYYFRAYATNSSGTSYSDVLDFTTNPLVLLGQSEVQWLNAVEQAVVLQESSSFQVQADFQQSLLSGSLIADSGLMPLGDSSALGTTDASSLLDSASTTLQSPTVFVPRFVYLKHEAEKAKPLTYLVEISEDSSVWRPADHNWQVEQTNDTVSAFWTSSEPPPIKVFFRVKAIMD